MVQMNVEELSSLSLLELTGIYNELTGRTTAKLKCSKTEAIAKILKASTLKTESEVIEEVASVCEVADVPVEEPAAIVEEENLEVADVPVEETPQPVVTMAVTKERKPVVDRQENVPDRIAQALKEFGSDFAQVKAIAERAGTKLNTTANYLSNWQHGRMRLPVPGKLEQVRGSGRFVGWRLA